MKSDLNDLELSACEVREKELTLEKQLKAIIAALEGDHDSFEKFDEEIDFEIEMFKVLDDLENNNLLSDIEKLDRSFQSKPELYGDYSKYISMSIIPLYLAKEREESKKLNSSIKNYLKPFYKSPENLTEVLFNVLNKLICYDQSSLVVDLCKKIYPQIAKSDEFFINPKYEIAEILIWDGLQDAYSKFKKNMSVDWSSYDKKFKPYGFQFKQSDFKSFEEVMKGNLDLDQLIKTFKNNTLLALFQIKLAFCCQMYDLDGTSFITSDHFASMIIDFLAKIPGRECCPLHVFFKIKPNLLIPYVSKLIENKWFDSTYEQFALLAALPIFYQVLLKKGVIEMKTIEAILPSVIALKSEYKKTFSDRSWMFNFTKRLEEQLILLT